MLGYIHVFSHFRVHWTIFGVILNSLNKFISCCWVKMQDKFLCVLVSVHSDWMHVWCVHLCITGITVVSFGETWEESLREIVGAYRQINRCNVDE